MAEPNDSAQTSKFAESMATEKEPEANEALQDAIYEDFEKNWDAESYTPPSGEPPDEHYPDPSWIRVLQQGPEPASVGYAVAALIDLLRWQRGDTRTASPRFLYENAKKYDEWGGEDYDGSSVQGGMKGWAIRGVVDDAVWSYASTEPLAPEAQSEAIEDRPARVARIGPSIDAIRAAFQETPGVVASAMLHDGWNEAKETIRFDPEATQRETGGHAFLIVGYTPDGFIVQNSWGEGWGGMEIDGKHVGGLSVWRYEDAEKHLQDAWMGQLQGQPVDRPGRADAAPGTPRFATAVELAGYLSDLATSTDTIGVDRDVVNLSQVVMAEEWKPPLSIGLFGDWGTGKSSFIQMMRRKVGEIALTARKADDAHEKTAYVKNVIQIEFNAWHYLDANLWASLVTHLFEQIQEQLYGRPADAEDEERQSRLEGLFDELETTRARVAAAEDAREHAGKRLTELNTQADLAIEQREGFLGQLTALRQAGKQAWDELVQGDDALKEQFDRASSKLGTAVSYDDLMTKADEIRGLAGKARELYRRVKESPRQLIWLVPLAAAIFIFNYPPIAGAIEQAVGKVFEWIATAATVGLSWWRLIEPNLKDVREGLGQVDALSTKVEEARIAGLATLPTEIEAKEREIALLTKEREAALEHSAEVESQIRELRAATGLQSFLLDRVADADYKEQLGIIAMVRRDIGKLQEKLNNGVWITAEGKEGEEKEERRTFDRIVLYIDDLDRCPPDRVIEVLQAVHLLMAIPLFVVVVAVDPRWLLECLELHYAELLRQKNTHVGAEWETSPQNYLEKIIQIPYSLRRMTAEGYQDFVESLFGKKEKELSEVELLERQRAEAHLEYERRLRERERALRTAQEDESDDEAAKKKASEAASMIASQIEEARNEEKRLASQTREAQQKAIDSFVPTLDPNPRNLSVGDPEKEFVARLHPLLSTPRITKRLVNTYRLIRVSLEKEELDRVEQGEYEAILILLAVLYGEPIVAPQFFAELQRTNGSDLVDFIDNMEDYARLPMKGGGKPQYDHARWLKLKTAIAKIEPKVRDIATYRRWVRGVGRYSFLVGHELRHS